MLTKDQISDKVKEIIIDQLGVEAEQVVPEAKFLEDLGADSLDAVEMIMFIEDEFDLSIDEAEAEKLKTVKDLVEYLVQETAQSEMTDHDAAE